MKLKDILISLADVRGVSGDEHNACELALGYLKEFTDNAYIKNNCVIGHIGERSENKPHVLIDAHIDQIGMICSYITDDGFIKVGNLGGLDRRILAAQQVVIHGRKDIKGIISSVPPHLSDDEKKVPEMSDIIIDTGYSKKQLEEIVSQGDTISFDTKCRELLNNRISGHSLDDRCGVASILYMLELLKDEFDKLGCSMTILFSSQEELGERGAATAVYEINPDIAIAVDVSFAVTADESEEKCGFMGKGCMIGIAPVLDRQLSDTFINIAKEKNIPYQIEIMNGETGTNADRFSISRCGVRAVTCSIPLKYMHTPAEEIEISDVENTALLMAEYIRRCGK
ncbi:MAG: M42 family metallopeptidase [Oscillospiraceae bacterium]